MKDFILASTSPRRVELLERAGLVFKSVPSYSEEEYDPKDPVTTIVRKLALDKAKNVWEKLGDKSNSLVVGADTIVSLEGEILHKPQNAELAYQMLKKLSGKTHEVITGVGILSIGTELSFTETTEVTFSHLTDEEIHYYINHFPPYDKAGGYAIQEWIGLIGIKEIKGNFYNVMGLPINKLLRKLNGLGFDIKMKP